MPFYHGRLPWQWDLPRGIVNNVQGVPVYGETPALTTGALQDIWDLGSTYSYLSSAAPLYMQAATTGVIGGAFTITGLNSSWDLTTATGSLSTANGQTQNVVVSTATLWLRVFAVENQSSVNSTANVYLATATTVVSTATGAPPLANTKAMIRSGYNKTHMAQYTVPRDNYGQITQLHGSVSRTSGSTGDKDALLRLQVREQGKGFVNKDAYTLSLSNGATPFTFDQWENIPGKADIRLRGIAHHPGAALHSKFSLFNLLTSSTGG